MNEHLIFFCLLVIFPITAFLLCVWFQSGEIPNHEWEEMIKLEEK